MHQDFWHEKWERMEIGFHLNEVNKMLLKYWPRLDITPGELVLVPLCGKSLDIIWLKKQGYSVVGIELSELALDHLADDLQAETGVTVKKSHEKNRVIYQGDGVLLIAGDFFSVSADDLIALTGKKVAAVYDRAAIVALPEDMRRQYAQHLIELTAGAVQLLITLDYDQSKRNGPPFAVGDSEVKALYSDAYKVSQLNSRELIEQELRFRQEGLDSFILRVYQLG